MHIHILGICGTFMGGLAILARELGYKVTGSDQNVYPPMSTQLEAAGIKLIEGYDPIQLDTNPDQIIIGNAMSRGNPCVEAILNRGLPFTSGPQWLAEHVLKEKWVLACSGTHGKTSTSSMLAWILENANMAPGFLIGGVPGNFGLSARIGQTPFFVIEADEYDSAFFDKRSKFVHYRPRTLILNNLEFDHADIFEDLAAIQKQFHHVIRTVPELGKVIFPRGVTAIDEVLEKGVWSEQASIKIVNAVDDVDANIEWQAVIEKTDGSVFDVYHEGGKVATVNWSQLGHHNVSNALAAIAAAHHVGVSPIIAAEALASFEGVKRRMELRGQPKNVTVYDDFAHHPTAIQTTLIGLRNKVGNEKIIAVIEPRSNTMRMGIHAEKLAASAEIADECYWYQPANIDWSLEQTIQQSAEQANKHQVFNNIDKLVEHLSQNVEENQHVVIMSNGGFGGIHQQLITAIENS